MVRALASSGVIHLPPLTLITTERVSSTSVNVSSVVTARNGPRSWAMRGAKGARMASSPPSQKLFEKPQVRSA